MAKEGFIDHWAGISEDKGNPQSPFATIITASRKVIFSTTLETSIWPNSVLAKGDFVDEVMTLKGTCNKDIIAYGGSSFANSLIRAGLVDE